MTLRTRKSKSSKVKRVAVFGSIAAAAGYIAGILTAPTSGEKTRGNIKKTADKAYAEAEKDITELNRELTRLISEAKADSQKLGKRAQKELDEIIEAAKDTKEKGREMLSAIHEGEAQDKDLKRAVKDANNALQHLRDYLKK